MTPADIAPIIEAIGHASAGLSGLIVALAGLGWWKSRSDVRAILSSHAATTASRYEWIGNCLETAVKGRDLASYWTLKTCFPNGQSIRVPMIQGVGLTVSENITLAVTSHQKDYTLAHLTCIGFGRLEPHSHPDCIEEIHVIRGVITHLETGNIYRAGDKWVIEQEEFHSAQFSGVEADITYHPTLPTAKDHPIELAALRTVFQS